MIDYLDSKIVGKLIRDEAFSDWWRSGEIFVPMLEQKISIVFMDFEPTQDEKFMDQADEALSHFLSFDKAYRDSISGLAYRNCIEFLDAVEYDEDDEPLRLIRNENEIWKFIYPTEILVAKDASSENGIYVIVACDCEWEREHGLQLVFKNGKQLTRVSEQDGHWSDADAYGTPDIENRMAKEQPESYPPGKKWWKFW